MEENNGSRENIQRAIFHMMRKDIDFTSHGGFSNNYILRGRDENAIRSAFTYEVISFFEDHKGLTVEAKGSRLFYYRNGIRIRPDKIQYFITEGLEILKLFKASKTV